MNWRKILQIPNQFQRELISVDKEIIMQKCDMIASVEYKEQKEAAESHDSVCPKCHARKELIVDKIRNVHGSGKVEGSLKLGYGNISGSMNIQTDEINHCNSCGNEWKKYKLKYVSKTQIVRVALNYLGDVLDLPQEKCYKWKLETIKVFDDSFIESILELMKENDTFIYSSTKHKLNRKTLSKHYKSVYDKKV